MSELDRLRCIASGHWKPSSKAFLSRSEEMRRSWLILARDWTKMAEQVEAITSIVPSQEVAQLSLTEVIGSALAKPLFR